MPPACMRKRGWLRHVGAIRSNRVRNSRDFATSRVNWRCHRRRALRWCPRWCESCLEATPLTFMQNAKVTPRTDTHSAGTPARILIADDHDVVRMGLRLLLESQPGWVVCGEARTGREAVAKAIELRPDLIVLDVSMPELNGVEVTRQVRRSMPASILIVTMYDSERMARAAIEAGASGYLSKADA